VLCRCSCHFSEESSDPSEESEDSFEESLDSSKKSEDISEESSDISEGSEVPFEESEDSSKKSEDISEESLDSSEESSDSSEKSEDISEKSADISKKSEDISENSLSKIVNFCNYFKIRYLQFTTGVNLSKWLSNSKPPGVKFWLKIIKKAPRQSGGLRNISYYSQNLQTVILFVYSLRSIIFPV
jgi:hypothetical protein